MFVREEIQHKKALLREAMKLHGLDAVVIKRQGNFSWLTGGGLSMVGIANELGIAALVILPDAEFAVCSAVEGPRMAREECLEDQGYSLQVYPWQQERETEIVRRLAGPGRVAADYPLPGAEDANPVIAPLRYALTEWELARYRALCLFTAEAVEDTCRTVRQGDRECAVTGRLAERLWAERVDFVVTLCAADERTSLYRHPIPTEKRVEKFLMLCVNSRKGGLITSITRFVHFGKRPSDLEEKYAANVYIDCAMMAATIPGRPWKDAYLAGKEAYARFGKLAEMDLHHQGGPLGYQPRDARVTEESTGVVLENQAFAWNPTITGVKSEDVMLARSSGPEILTKPCNYPTRECEAGGIRFVRPDILEL